MRSYGGAYDTSPGDYVKPPMPNQAQEVKRLAAEVARLEHRSDCLEERIAELEDIVSKMIMLSKLEGSLL